MMNARSNWYGDEAWKLIQEEFWKRLMAATIYFWNHVEQALNVSAKIGKGTKASAYRASRPGQPPHKRTGWLQRHVIYEMDRQTLTTRVGVLRNAIYGLYLEFGTWRMAARPWLFATLTKVMGQLRAMIEGGGEITKSQ